MILRARVILPVTQPPIENGAVGVRDNRISAVLPSLQNASISGGPVVDLGDSILLPGLVNAHCHLDYTAMAGLFPEPRGFTDWIKLITTAKAAWSYSEFADSWTQGARMLLRTGTTSVADIEAVPELLPDVTRDTPLRVFSFLEMTGVKSRRDPAAILGEAVAKIESLPANRGACWLSPHSPYSTTPELLRLAAQVARQRQWRVTTHVAESALEVDMFMRGQGEMFEWLKRNDRDMSDCGLGSPVQHLDRNGALDERQLAVHVNHLAPGDAALLAKRGASVVHCPRSHAYFRHQSFPRRELSDAGVNLCLGTDSLASITHGRQQTAELNLFEEMRAFANVATDIPPSNILRMVTVNGARALGLGGQIGEISPGAFADLIAIPFSGTMDTAWDAVLQHRGDVSASMINGQWAIEPKTL